MFNIFKSKGKMTLPSPVECGNEALVAPMDSLQIPIEEVADEVFSSKVMGDGVAFKPEGDKVAVCAPANGVLTVLFKTKHAFGLTTEDGVELLIHIGIDTVSLKGEGFEELGVAQGDRVQAGQPIVMVDLKKVGASFDTTTMLIVTNSNGCSVAFGEKGSVEHGQVIGQINQ